MIPERRLLLVHAHPDDETIGTGATMAKYVAEGAGVTLVTCTAGEMGEILVPDLEHLAADRDDGLGDHRQTELAAAMKVLGVTDYRFLGGPGAYRDSGMKWHEDGHAIAADDVHENAFWHADLTEAADHLVKVIREVRPQVLATYDQFGGYGHPDHIQAHRVAMYAVQLAAVPSYRLELGDPWDVAKVYWTAMSESRMRASLRELREAGDTTTFEGMDPDGPLPLLRHARRVPRGRRRRHRLPRAEDGRDEGARQPDHRRRAVLRALQQQGQLHLGHRVLPDRQGHPGSGGRRRTRGRPLRRTLMRVLAALPLAVIGAWTALCAVALNSDAPWLALGIAAPAAATYALPGGWPRFGFIAGWLTVLASRCSDGPRGTG